MKGDKMEINLRLELSEDFTMVCDIFGVRAEDLLQKIISDISLPYYYSHLNEKGRWATLLFLDYLDTLDIADSEMILHEPYMEKLSKTIAAILNRNADDKQLAEESARKVVGEWHKVVIANRAKYLLDGLGGDG